MGVAGGVQANQGPAVSRLVQRRPKGTTFAATPKNLAASFPPRDLVPLRIHVPGPSVEVLAMASTALTKALPSLSNLREHYQARAKRAREHRDIGAWLCVTACAAYGIGAEQLRGSPGVVLTRIGRPRLDSDNVSGSLKSIRDGVAAWLGVGDGIGGGVVWYVAQELGNPGVRLEIGRIIT